ncbi:MAG: hypothetical protein QOK22_2154, partial [Gaiellaceae bacterium]|nr:hypothetical protein [Gaiellaceae bacterium]
MPALESLAGVSWRAVSVALARRRQAGWLVGIALVAAITGVIQSLESHARPSGLGTLYLLAVLPVALLWGTVAAVGVSLLSAAALAFQLDVSQSADGVALGVFLVTALFVAQLAAQTRREARAAKLLAREQAALRRVATLVARGLPPGEIFAAVAEEVGKLLATDGARILRYGADATATVLAGWSASVDVPPELDVGARLTLDGTSVSALVFRSGRPARIDDYPNAAGPLSRPLLETGVRSAAGAPIVVEGRLWGVIAVGSAKPAPLPQGAESRLAEFTKLAATAIANAESRSELALLAAEQSALRRVATLVARGIPADKLFAAVAG